MAMEYFCCYHSYRKKLAKLSDEALGRLFRKLLEYSETGEVSDVDMDISIAFDFISDDIDRAQKTYEEKCRKNRENRQQRTITTVNDRQRPLMTVNERNQNKDKNKNEDKNEDKDKEKIKEKISLPVGSDKKETTTTRFVVPSLEEVKAYCLERKNGIDAAHFVDYYTANGWKVGKQNMKDWKAAIRTWEHNERKFSPEVTGDKYAVGDDYYGL